MSTRCNIEIYDDDCKEPGAMLYHHSDGYGSFMRPKLKRFLKATYEKLKEAGYGYWWDAERVAAVMILLSAEDYEKPMDPGSHKATPLFGQPDSAPGDFTKQRPNNGVPVFQPCMRRHGDIAVVWKVRLKPDGEFTIREASPRRS